MPKLTRVQKLLVVVRDKLARIGYGSKADLAKHLKMRPAHLSRWLSGDVIPSAEQALALMEWCSLPMPIKRQHNMVERMNAAAKAAGMVA